MVSLVNDVKAEKVKSKPLINFKPVDEWCAFCGKEFLKTSPRQKYCRRCSKANSRFKGRFRKLLSESLSDRIHYLHDKGVMGEEEFDEFKVKLSLTEFKDNPMISRDGNGQIIYGDFTVAGEIKDKVVVEGEDVVEDKVEDDVKDDVDKKVVEVVEEPNEENIEEVVEDKVETIIEHEENELPTVNLKPFSNVNPFGLKTLDYECYSVNDVDYVKNKRDNELFKLLHEFYE